VAKSTQNFPHVAPRRYEKGVARSAEIILAAKKLFAERGYKGTVLRDISSACGISHTTLLHYFPNKEALLMAVLNERDVSARAELKSLSSPQDILDYTQRIMEVENKKPFMVELAAKIGAEATDPSHPAHDFFRERFLRLSKDLEELLRVQQKRGQLREGVDPHIAAVGFFALRNGAQLQWLADPTTVNVAELVHWYQASLFKPQALALARVQPA